MGKKPSARQASPMWVNTEDLPTSSGHPFFERLNRILAESGFDAFVEGLCAAFYADRLGRPSLRPGRYFRLLLIGYFEAGDCVAGGRFVESAVVSGSGRDGVGAGPLDAVAHAAEDRCRDPRSGVHLGSGAAGRSGFGEGKDGRRRCAPRRWKRTRRCEASNGGTPGNRTRRSFGGWRRRRGLRRRRARSWRGSTGPGGGARRPCCGGSSSEEPGGHSPGSGRRERPASVAETRCNHSNGFVHSQRLRAAQHRCCLQSFLDGSLTRLVDPRRRAVPESGGHMR